MQLRSLPNLQTIEALRDRHDRITQILQAQCGGWGGCGCGWVGGDRGGVAMMGRAAIGVGRGAPGCAHT